jgi:hypothetical protein
MLKSTYMSNKIDISQAKTEFEYAVEEYQKVFQKIYIGQGDRHWQNFINHIEKTFTIIGDLVKNTPAKIDFDAAMKFKHKDKLLKYIRFARNVNQHSAALVSKENERDLTGPALVSLIKVVGVKTDDGTPFEQDLEPPKELVLVLLPVKNEEGQLIQPPRVHMGKKLKDPTDPKEVGNLALEYYAQLMNDLMEKWG